MVVVINLIFDITDLKLFNLPNKLGIWLTKTKIYILDSKFNYNKASFAIVI